jgi:type III restriction enzyme
VNGVSPATQYDFVYVDEESFEMYQPKTFTALMKGFQEYRK